jgi:hypothetical protein
LFAGLIVGIVCEFVIFKFIVLGLKWLGFEVKVRRVDVLHILLNIRVEVGRKDVAEWHDGSSLWEHRELRPLL